MPKIPNRKQLRDAISRPLSRDEILSILDDIQRDQQRLALRIADLTSKIIVNGVQSCSPEKDEIPF